MSEEAIPQLAGSQGLQKTYFLPVRSFLMDFYSAVAALLTGTIRSRFLDPIKDRETKEKVKQRWGGGNSPSWLAPHQLAVVCGMPGWESFIENLESFLQRKLSIQQSDTRDHQDDGFLELVTTVLHTGQGGSFELEYFICWKHTKYRGLNWETLCGNTLRL